MKKINVRRKGREKQGKEKEKNENLIQFTLRRCGSIRRRYTHTDTKTHKFFSFLFDILLLVFFSFFSFFFTSSLCSFFSFLFCLSFFPEEDVDQPDYEDEIE